MLYSKLSENSFKVIKSLMAPNVINNLIQSSKNKNSEENRLKSFKREMKKYQNFLKNNLEYVGENFAYEARLIHYNSKKKTNGIFGKATKEQVKELNEEGIETQTIPWIDDKEN